MGSTIAMAKAAELTHTTRMDPSLAEGKAGFTLPVPGLQKFAFFRTQPVSKVQEKERRGREATTPLIPKVCEKLDTSSRSDVVQNMHAKQTSFQAGGLRNFLAQLEGLTSESVILQYVTGVQIEFKGDSMPRQSSHRPSILNTKERAIVQAEIDNLITKGVIVPSSPEKDDFVSTIFLRPKKDGSHRTILNLKQFNEFLEYHHFKMVTLENVISMMKPGCYMASVDLKDAYYTVPIDFSHQKSLRFCFRASIFSTLVFLTVWRVRPVFLLSC